MAEVARLSEDFEDHDAVVLGGSTENEFCKLAWRGDNKDPYKLPIWQFADTKGRRLRRALAARRRLSLHLHRPPRLHHPARLCDQPQYRSRAAGYATRARRAAD